MKAHGNTFRAIAALLALLPLCLCPSAVAQNAAMNANAAPSLVEVYWMSSKTVVIPGISNIIVLDQEVARAETRRDSVQFFGLQRGETVALGYVDGKAISVRIRVVERPQIALSPASLRRQADMASGTFGSTGQLSDSNGTKSFSLLNAFSWSQLAGAHGRLDVTSQVEDNALSGGHVANIRQASIFYHDPKWDVHGLDFNVSLTGNATPRYVSPFSVSDFVELRGGSVSLKKNKDVYTLFGGTTIPAYFLTLGSTRDVAGLSIQRSLTDNLVLYETTSYINTPQNLLSLNGPRENDFMQTAGARYLLNDHWSFQGVGGVSNHGGLARGEMAFTSHRLTAFAAAYDSSQLFPMNRVQSLFSGTSAVKGGVIFNASEVVTDALYYQHTETAALGSLIRAGRSDYITPSVSVRITPAQDLNISYTYSRNEGGFSSEPTTGDRFDSNWNYRITPRVANSAQFSVGSIQDPLQLSSEDQFTFRDSLSFPIGHGNNGFVSYAHDRRDPSLVQKLNAELGLLTPGLRQLFLQDPVSFVQSGSLPPEVRALLEAQQPATDSVSAAGQFRVGTRLSVNPTVSFARINSGTTDAWTPFVGYGLIYQLRSTLLLNSSLNNGWVLSTANGGAQRTTVLSFGFVKSFTAAPDALIPGRRGRVIEGRVFRDNNLNGTFNAGEPGMSGIQVQLDNGDSVLTDAEGRYKFTGVSANEHTVTLALTQFRDPVRMTTSSQLSAHVIREHIAVVNFGVVNFARVVGNVFNDLRFETRRQGDSVGLGEVRLVLEDSDHTQKFTVTTQSGGDYSLTDVPPGDYTLTVDTSSLPANYVLPADSFPVHVAPVSTVVQDVPTRALRSISGRVLLKLLTAPSATPGDSGNLKIGGVTGTQGRAGQAAGKPGQAGRGQAQGAGAASGGAGDYNLVPMAGVQLTAGFGVVKTDENGNFLLRDLPAGDLTITLVPVKQLVEGMKVPTGVVHMPPQPIQVKGATIVISNPELAPYLTRNIGDSQGKSAYAEPAPVPRENPPARPPAAAPQTNAVAATSASR